MKRILFLYTELAEYTMACLEALETHDQLEIHVVKWPVNNEAPFRFRSLKRTTLYERNNYSDQALIELAKNINPDVVLTSGWVDKGYLSVVKQLHQNSVTVILLDNHWSASLRQRIGSLIARSTFLKHFSHAWVPGKPQYHYALKLGFAPDNIHTGFYSADTSRFSQFYEQFPMRKNNLPKKFIYIGRYVDFKGVNELWSAFSAYRQDGGSWTMTCIGTGELFDSKPQIDGLTHAGFVQPNDLPNFLEKAGVFILPSKKEPWGVVVHEMAAAGFPIVCTSCVGAATTFVTEGKNGWIIPPNNTEAILKTMKHIESLSEKQLSEMGQLSHELSQQLSPQKWSQQVLELAEISSTGKA